MCGICGIVVFDDKSMPLAAKIRSMCSSMSARGPNDEGYLLMDAEKRGLSAWAGEATPSDYKFYRAPYIPEEVIQKSESNHRLAFGHRRLSILDLSIYGHQPMCNESKNLWIIYNGEIFNFLLIKEELLSEGYQFRSRTDTEVVLKSYEAWGVSAFEKLNGMFAFAVFDKKRGEVILVRDRIGIKPLYYHLTHSYIVFGSDIKSIIASGLYEPEMDDQGFHHCLSYSVAPRPMTCFRNVFSLEPGTWTKVNFSGRIRTGKYWDLDFSVINTGKSEDLCAIELEALLKSAVERQLISDVPIGTFMSGGIDSTLISAMAAMARTDITAFTLAYEPGISEVNELEEAASVAEKYSIAHRVKMVDEADIIEGIGDMTLCYEEPFNSLAPNYVISKEVFKDDIHCILNGIGGDELFAGYRWYRRLQQVLRIRRFVPPGLADLLVIPTFLGKRGVMYGGYLRSALTGNLANLYHYSFSTLNEEEKLALYTDDFKKRVRGYDSREILVDLYGLERRVFSDPYQVFSLLDLKCYIGNHHLYRLDQFTMRFSIEGRFPYLDHEVVEFACSLPWFQKIRNGVGKLILRKVGKKYLPPNCFTMPKKGFSFPLDVWMKRDLKNLVEEKLGSLMKRGIFQNSKVAEMYTKFLRGKTDYKKIWILVSSELWMEEFLDGKTRQ